MRSEDDGKWGPVACSYHPDLPKGTLLGDNNYNAVVLDRVAHWLVSSADYVLTYDLTYDVSLSAVGSIGLPKDLLPAR